MKSNLFKNIYSTRVEETKSNSIRGMKTNLIKDVNRS